VFEFHVSRASRERYGFDDTLFSTSGNVVFANLAAVRAFARKMNQARDAARNPDRAVHAGALNAMGLIDEALHVVLQLYREQADPTAMLDALTFLDARLGSKEVSRLLLAFCEEFPTADVYRGRLSAADWLQRSTGGTPNRAIALEEALFLWLANANPAFRRYDELFDDKKLASTTQYGKLPQLLREYFDTRPRFGPDDQNIVDLLRAPALASPDSLNGQLAFMRERWTSLLGEFLERLATGIGILQEEDLAIWMMFHPGAGGGGGGVQFGDSSSAAVPHFTGMEHEYERFSSDVEWMPKTVMIAKSIHVWLDQLSRQYSRGIHRLDQIPDEELDTLSRRGFNALWIIGVWERSRASQRIKQLTGNPEAAASAYSLYDYVIASDLGGPDAYQNLRDRASARGVRLASDMVPNHMGIDSRWVIEHPDWFLSLPHPPFPSYTFGGPDVSSDSRVEIKIEDHYYNRSDAAVVFMRRDQQSSETRFVYHGNDGTSFPWNDTAQLNYLDPRVREGVIQTILHVARQFPIIRFDAAMTLTKRHYQRLWFPEPGTGSAIASRAEYGLTKPDFDRAMPQEFWREVVDRVAAEAPGTLLLAEAFWLLEGYFVRTLGMHRVYNSAFMNMLRDEENANYRSVIKNTLEFDPDVLKRYVNFMSNPDERTAVDQFGKGDKYFGVCTLLATMPGLPMFGHGQIEGYAERYGMEYRRSYTDEKPDPWLVARHEREITPLLHRRALFAEVQNFLFYDFYTNEGFVNEDVFAYSNQLGDQRALVVYHNRYGHTRGWIRQSCGYAEKHGGQRHLRQRTLGDAFHLPHDGGMYLAFCDAVNGQEYLHRAADVREKGLEFDLGAYRCHVFVDWREIHDDGTRPWGVLCDRLAGRGVSSLHDALHALELEPVHAAFANALHNHLAGELALLMVPATGNGNERRRLQAVLDDAAQRARRFFEEARRYATGAAWRAAALPPIGDWSGDLEAAVQHFKQRLQSAMQVPELENLFSTGWPPQARAVLPSLAATSAEHAPVWTTILAWAALEGIGMLADPQEPARATERAIDGMRLREPIAGALEPLVPNAEDRWRLAAMLRASFAHAAWAPGFAVMPGQTAGTMSWIHDPDVAWLVGVHEHEGVRYLVKEPFERLMWWMSLRTLLEIASAPQPDPKKVRALEQELNSRIEAARQAGYRLEQMLDSIV
jgi:glycosidase